MTGGGTLHPQAHIQPPKGCLSGASRAIPPPTNRQAGESKHPQPGPANPHQVPPAEPPPPMEANPVHTRADTRHPPNASTVRRTAGPRPPATPCQRGVAGGLGQENVPQDAPTKDPPPGKPTNPEQRPRGQAHPTNRPTTSDADLPGQEPQAAPPHTHPAQLQGGPPHRQGPHSTSVTRRTPAHAVLQVSQRGKGGQGWGAGTALAISLATVRSREQSRGAQTGRRSDPRQHPATQRTRMSHKPHHPRPPDGPTPKLAHPTQPRPPPPDKSHSPPPPVPRADRRPPTPNPAGEQAPEQRKRRRGERDRGTESKGKERQKNTQAPSPTGLPDMYGGGRREKSYSPGSREHPEGTHTREEAPRHPGNPSKPPHKPREIQVYSLISVLV
ncbi:basic salivary proline-rich protein 4-like [Gouania willdenowi]|uniref:basic salivary proline-rich protein 4-like n=1 Tax=Gouania willdenowi TaxID=441366 RepID=UPI0010562CA2|nr:basic salivary proline-rich protein 4-like [Gouania willdenowi]